VAETDETMRRIVEGRGGWRHQWLHPRSRGARVRTLWDVLKPGAQPRVRSPSGCPRARSKKWSQVRSVMVCRRAALGCHLQNRRRGAGWVRTCCAIQVKQKKRERYSIVPISISHWGNPSRYIAGIGIEKYVVRLTKC
jgi:hypothetical protein